MVGWGRGYVALLHQHVCSNAIAGLRHTKKTRLLKHSQIWSPGGWTQLCSNYRTKPALNRALSRQRPSCIEGTGPLLYTNTRLHTGESTDFTL